MGGEPESTRVPHRLADLGGGQAAVVDRPVDTEGQIVVAAPGRDLLAYEHQHRAVPALLAPVASLERVVVREQDHVHAAAAGGLGDLAHRPGAVRVGRVQVDDAGQV